MDNFTKEVGRITMKILNVIFFFFLFLMSLLFLPFYPGWIELVAAILVMPSKRFQGRLDKIFGKNKKRRYFIFGEVLLFVAFLVTSYNLTSAIGVEYVVEKSWLANIMVRIAHCLGLIYGKLF